jgi:sorbitol/mannitol transport system permease protein
VRSCGRRLPLLPALIFTIALTQIPVRDEIFYSYQDWKIVRRRRASGSGF